MVNIILLTLLFYFIQFPIPALLSLKNVPLSYFPSNRDKEVNFSVLSGRGQRAINNLKESLLIFIPLALLSIIQEIDLTLAATIWLVLRVIYAITYYMGVSHVRSIVWVISIFTLIDMAIRVFKHSI